MSDNKELIEKLGSVVTEILLAHGDGFYDDGLQHADILTKAMRALSAAQPAPVADPAFHMASDGSLMPHHEWMLRSVFVRSEYPTALYLSPLPAQQGDVADERFEELLTIYDNAVRDSRPQGLPDKAHQAAIASREHCRKALIQHFKQSRPAAPAQAMQEGITLNVQEVQAVALWAIAARQRGCVSDDDEFLVARLQSALSSQAGSEA